MKTGLSIHQHLRDTLLASPVIRERVGERVHTIAAVQGTDFPFILCTRTALQPEYTKDGWAGDTVAVAIEIVSRSSTEAIELAEDVREVLEEPVVQNAEWGICEPALISATEGYSLDTDSYVESLQFTFKIN